MAKFVSAAQRKAVMAQLKEAGVKEKPISIRKTDRFFRARIREPRKFQKKYIRFKDIGRPGHTRLVIGRPKGMKTTRTQSVLIPIKDIR